jgi:hypothetical protein
MHKIAKKRRLLHEEPPFCLESCYGRNHQMFDFEDYSRMRGVYIPESYTCSILSVGGNGNVIVKKRAGKIFQKLSYYLQKTLSYFAFLKKQSYDLNIL